MRESSAICHGDKGKSPHGVLVSELLAAFFLRSLVAGVKLGSVNAVLNKWLVCDWPFLAPPQTPTLDAGTSKRSPITQLETSKPNQTSSRRTLLKAAAWATPVITIAVAAPLAAASINDAAVYLGDHLARHRKPQQDRRNERQRVLDTRRVKHPAHFERKRRRTRADYGHDHGYLREQYAERFRLW